MKLSKRYPVLLVVSILLSGFGAIFFVASVLCHYVWRNATISEPVGYYFVFGGYKQVGIGDRCVLNIPRTYLNIIRELGYKANTNTILKTIVASKGDIVTVTDNGILINDKLLPHSKYTESARGINFEPVNVGYRHKLTDSEYWVMGDSPHSFDSRYFGVVNSKQIVKKAVFLF